MQDVGSEQIIDTFSWISARYFIKEKKKKEIRLKKIYAFNKKNSKTSTTQKNSFSRNVLQSLSSCTFLYSLFKKFSFIRSLKNSPPLFFKYSYRGTFTYAVIQRPSDICTDVLWKFSRTLLYVITCTFSNTTAPTTYSYLQCSRSTILLNFLVQ